MDLKERQLISQLYRLLADQTFTERDIFALLILVRRHAPSGSAILEIANFVAHRERDKGQIQEFIQQGSNEALDVGYAKIDFYSHPVFTEGEIVLSLNEVLKKLGFLPLYQRVGCDVVLCIFSLLQYVAFTSKRTGELGTLLFGYDAKVVYLLAVMQLPSGESQIFPVLKCQNYYQDWDLKDQNHIVTIPNSLVRVDRNNGAISIISE